jgi:hypothetical protein
MLNYIYIYTYTYTYIYIYIYTYIGGSGMRWKGLMRASGCLIATRQILEHGVEWEEVSMREVDDALARLPRCPPSLHLSP